MRPSFHPSGGFRGGEGDVVEFVEKNVLGTIRLIEAARTAGAERFVLISTCAVHEKILDDRPLDETHPTLPTSHYGATRRPWNSSSIATASDTAIRSAPCGRPGVYGVARPAQNSKWFDLVSAVVRGEPVTCQRGGKEVHAADVAKAVGILLTADGVAGQAYNCCDRYVSEYDVATIARRISGSSSRILGRADRAAAPDRHRQDSCPGNGVWRQAAVGIDDRRVGRRRPADERPERYEPL